MPAASFPKSLIPDGLTKEKAVSLGASIAVNLAMIVAFASIADIGVEEVQKGASLVVVGLTGGEAAKEAPQAQKAPSQPAPPPVSEPKPPAPAPDFARQDEKPLQPKVALLERSEPVAERTDASPIRPQSEADSSEQMMREAAERQRRAQEAARARAAEQAQNEAKAAASNQAEARSGGGSNYKGVLYQHLMRFRRPNTIGAGTVMVRLSLNDNGGVQDVGIARSSGSAALDREAMQMVRRANPFPKPPPGAGRNFVFAIEGK